MEGVYLVAPTAESVEAIKRDFSSPADALYSKVHLFFLERVPPDLLQSIKQCPTLVSRLKTFKVRELESSLCGAPLSCKDTRLCCCCLTATTAAPLLSNFGPYRYAKLLHNSHW